MRFNTKFYVTKINRLTEKVDPPVELIVPPPRTLQTYPHVVFDPPLDRNEKEKLKVYWQSDKEKIREVKDFVSFQCGLALNLSTLFYAVYDRFVRAKVPNNVLEIDWALIKKLVLDVAAKEKAEEPGYEERTVFYLSDREMTYHLMKDLQKGNKFIRGL